MSIIKRRRKPLKIIGAPPKSLLVGIPCSWPWVPIDFFENFTFRVCGDIMADAKQLGIANVAMRLQRYGGSLTVARDTLCIDAMRGNFDFLLFIDADQVYPSGLLAGLHGADADIASCRYHRKSLDRAHCPVDGDARTDGTDTFVPHIDAAYAQRDESGAMPPGRRYIAADLVGMGGTLIRVPLLCRMYSVHGPAFFDYARHWHGGKPAEYDPASPVLDGLEWRTEDVTFCARARELGATIKVDLDSVAGHITTRIIGEADWMTARTRMGEARIYDGLACQTLLRFLAAGK